MGMKFIKIHYYVFLIIEKTLIPIRKLQRYDVRAKVLDKILLKSLIKMPRIL